MVINHLRYILEPGYLDRFNVDLGWTANGSSPSGLWERAKPTLTTLSGEDCNPGNDSEDCGELCLCDR